MLDSFSWCVLFAAIQIYFFDDSSVVAMLFWLENSLPEGTAITHGCTS